MARQQAWHDSRQEKPRTQITERAEQVEHSLRLYVEDAWRVVEPATLFVPNWHIDAICEHLEAVTSGQIRNLLINVPPRHTKSTLVSVCWPTWTWIRRPEARWLTASYAASLAIRDALKSRRVIQSPWYQANWSDRFHLTGDQNAKTRYENDRTGYRIATSVGGSSTGEGGDFLVCDDPHNLYEIDSDVIREGVLSWWDEVMSTRLNDPRTSGRVIVMQRGHERDLSGHVLERGDWEHLCLPAEYEGPRMFTSIGWSDPRTKPGELLNPNRYGVAELAVLKRELGSQKAAAQLQQRPSPAEGGVLKRHWWRHYQQRPDRFDQVIQSWDCAFKDLDTSDYVVGQVWGRLGANCYLLEQVRGRWDLPATLAAVQALSARTPRLCAKLVEDKANGPAVIQMLRAKVPGLIAVNPAGGKLARANAVAPLIEAGNVWLPERTAAPWVDDLIEEAAAFPRGANDDMVDALTQALLRLNLARQQPVGEANVIIRGAYVGRDRPRTVLARRHAERRRANIEAALARQGGE